MMKIILGILSLISLAACDQGQNPVVGSWSYKTSCGLVTYTFNADKSCSLSAPDFTTGGTKTLRGTYTATNASPASPEQLLVDVTWEDATTSSAQSAVILTPLSWNTTTRGFSINLDKQ
jgi:hypothetical protein